MITEVDQLFHSMIIEDRLQHWLITAVYHCGDTSQLISKLTVIALVRKSARWGDTLFRHEHLVYFSSYLQNPHQITDEWNSFIPPAVFFDYLPARDLKPDKVGEVRTRGLKLTVIVPPYSDLRSGFTAPCGLPNQTAVINSLPTSSYFHSFARTHQSKGGKCAQAVEDGASVPWVSRLMTTRF